MAETRNDADAVFDRFIQTDGLGCPEAVACLGRDR